MAKAVNPDKASVLRRYPHAHAYSWAGPNAWFIYLRDTINRCIGSGQPTAAKAWAQARKRLRLRRPDGGKA